MKIGSNNSLTYLDPFSWWFTIFKWFNKHQEVSYDKQYEYSGVRMFDFKLYVNKNNRIIVKCGKCEFPLFSFYEVLDYFNKKEDVTVLITLDSSFNDHLKQSTPSIEAKFREVCYIIESIYEHINFCGGYRKFDKKLIYQFKWEKKNGMPYMLCPSELSFMYRTIQRWFPFLMKFVNKRFIEHCKNENGYLMLDYVNRR